MTKREIKNRLIQQCGSNSRFCSCSKKMINSIYKVFKRMIKKQHYKLWMISDIGINKNNLYIIVLERYILIIDLDTYRR